MLLEPALGTIFWTVVTFLSLLFILKKIAWGPILEMLSEREKKIREALEKADATQKESEAAMAKQQEVMELARKEAQELVAKSRKMAEASKEETLQKAQVEAANLLERAKKEITQEREKAVQEIRSQTAEISVSIASKLIGRSLSKDDHKGLIEDSLTKMTELN